MDQRISLITLGVTDPEAAAAFYEALGWTRVAAPEGIIAFDLIGQTLGLYPLEMLARDMGMNIEALGHGAATYAYNVRDKQEVAALLERARDAGAKIIKDAHDVAWGGHIGYFADPEGHVWEIAWNPHSPLGPNGEFQWEGVA